MTKEIETLFEMGESESLEFKSNFNAELIETLVAFANTKGGRVIMGVGPKHEAIGVVLNSESIQNWINEIKTKTSPSLIPDVHIIDYKNKSIVIFSVQEYPIKPVATKGKYFKRVTNSNHLLTTSEVVNFHLQSFNTSWDYHINSNFKVDDISLEKVQNAIDLTNRSDIKIYDDPLTFLTKNDLIREGKVTNAAYLLFTNRDTVFTTIELGRFQTDTIIKDSTRSKTDILNQVDQIMDFIKKHINKEIIITGQPRNTERWQYPLEALREIVINMIVHRDYRSSSDSIIKVFDTRIEFYNPGRLPDSITITDLLLNNYRSTPRNKLIADFCKSIGLIEKYGSGIRRIIEHFKQANLPQPHFTNISEGFMVTVFTAEINSLDTDDDTDNDTDNDTDKRVKKIINLISENNSITTRELADKCSVSQVTIKRDIEKLKLQGILKRIGKEKTGHWQIL